MCAKVTQAKKGARAVDAPRSNPTPQRNSNRTASKTPARAGNQPYVLQPDDDSTHSSDELDFLGIPPSDNESSSEQNGNGDADDGNTDESRESTEQSSPQPSKTPERRPPRKQTQPKKRKDKITKEVIRLQASTKLLIPRLPFQRLVREILQQFKNDFRVQTATLECLQEAAEYYLVALFEDSYICCLHRNRITLTDKDLRLVHILRGPNDPGNLGRR